MRPYAKNALLLLLCVGATRVALGQESRPGSDRARQVSREVGGQQQKAIKSRPLTSSEGLSILGAALDARHYAEFPSDCSHLVHELYGRAGFPYAYASSLDLYAGIDEFLRVASPQPGDLAVWRGHAGVVVNPAQHSFFSALTSGLGVDAYDSPYWKRRGHPRFYRYVKPVPSRVLSASVRAASLRPTALDKTERREGVAEEPVSEVAEESSNDSGHVAKHAEIQPVNPEIPGVVVVNSVRPNPEQVDAAILQACQDSELSLRGQDLFVSKQSLIGFDCFEVKKVHISGNEGWVEVQIDELVSLTAAKAEVRKRSERQRWLLTRRDKTSWELTPPRDTIYLPRDIAERVLAHELAKLTEDRSDTSGRSQKKAELALLLSVLLK